MQSNLQLLPKLEVKSQKLAPLSEGCLSKLHSPSKFIIIGLLLPKHNLTSLAGRVLFRVEEPGILLAKLEQLT